MASSKARHDPKGISPLEVIFSCSVCYETLPQIYAGHPETVGGLSDGINPTHRLVSRVYLASCCHVICIKHIGDGVEAGPAFFKKGDRPTAPCPVCIKEKGDAQPRELYSVRGFRKGQYDPVIPACWFDTPPMKLEVSSTEMEALRFHYVSLLRYGKQVTALREQDKQELAVTKQNCRSLEATAAEQQEKILALEQEVQRLSAAEDRLTKYEKRMPEIRSHLQILPTLVEQNKAMKERLAMLGYSMLNQPIRYDKIPMDNGANILQDIPESAPTLRGETAASPAAVRPGTFTNKVGSIPYPSDFSSRPQKRQRVESPLLEHNIHAEQYNNGRSAMPPPPRPLSRMKSLKKFIPTLRKRSGTSGNTPGRLEEGNDVQVLQDGRVATIGLPTRFTAGTTRPSARLEFIQRSPLSRAFQEAPQSAVRNPPPIVTEEDMDDDLYRPPTPYASKQAQSAQSPPTLPHDRSYIHIMDGITPGSPDLAIRDPRHSFDFEYGRNDEAGPSAIPQSPTKRWSLGHPFLHQSPTQAPNERGAKPLPGLPEHRADPVTPAPKRISQQSTEVESVVSPFFSNKNRTSKVYSRAGLTEQPSRRPLPGTYPSQRARITIRAEPDWHKGKSLNGLSFINSPLNTRNEPIEYGTSGSGYTRSRPSHQGRHMNSHGYIMRPTTRRSPWASDSAYGSAQREIHHPGVRSSYDSRQDTMISPMRNLFSSVGRRTVRR